MSAGLSRFVRLLVALAFAFDLSPWLRGGYGWRWQYLPAALPPAPPRRRVMTPEEAYLTTSLLRSVVESGSVRSSPFSSATSTRRSSMANSARS